MRGFARIAGNKSGFSSLSKQIGGRTSDFCNTPPSPPARAQRKASIATLSMSVKAWFSPPIAHTKR